MPPPLRVVTHASKAKADGSAPTDPSPIGFFEAFLLPNVLSYAIAFGFFKLVGVVLCCSLGWEGWNGSVLFGQSYLMRYLHALQVNYAMFFQLPVILASHFDQSTSNIISSLYSVGMMPGGIVCGVRHYCVCLYASACLSAVSVGVSTTLRLF